MAKSNKNLVLELAERIELIQEHIRNVEQAAYFAQRRAFNERKDLGALRSALIECELDEWRQLFMWGLTLSDDERKRVKAAARDRFLSEKSSVAHWLSTDGVTPGMWLCSDEDEFRELVRRVFPDDHKTTPPRH